jgi:glycosyltransferase involved in cell wall biosynthesis
MPTAHVLHCTLAPNDQGSIQELLGYHHRRDAAFGLQSRFVSYFDRSNRWDGDYVGLGGHGWETVGALRRRFAAAARRTPVDVAVYHDGWALDWFAPIDGAARRFLFLHTERPQLDAALPAYASRVDGFLSVSRGMADHVRRILPDYPAERVQAVSYFVDMPAEAAAARSPGAPPPGPLRFGYAGRVVRPQKRLERLPALLAALDRRRVDYVFEVLGAGDYLGELQRLLQGNPRVKFIPWQQGRDYWQTLAGWRAIVLLSDFEGFSRAMLEGITAGALPVHPDFSPAAAELLGPEAGGLYPVGDMEAAADRLAALARLSPAEAGQRNAACRAHLSHLTPDNYFANFSDFVQATLAAPAWARPEPLPWWHDRMLLGAYTRLVKGLAFVDKA